MSVSFILSAASLVFLAQTGNVEPNQNPQGEPSKPSAPLYDGAYFREIVRILKFESAKECRRVLHGLIANIAILNSSRVSPVELSQVVGAVASRLSDPDWQVQILAATFFQKHIDMRAIPSLIAALDLEQAKIQAGKGRKRVFYNLLDALLLTGAWVQDLENPKAWKLWLQKNFLHLDLALKSSRPGEPKLSIPYYFGIPVKSDRVVFILDISKSMLETCDPGLFSGFIKSPANRKGWTKLDWAKAELIEVLQNYKGNNRFNVIFFAAEPERLFLDTVPATLSNIIRATSRIQSVRGLGGTNIWDSLALAMGIRSDLSMALQGMDADTIVLLTDGEPNMGTLTATSDILATMKRLNRDLNVAIHTVYFSSVREMGSDWLRQLSRENFGEYRSPPFQK